MKKATLRDLSAWWPFSLTHSKAHSGGSRYGDLNLNYAYYYKNLHNAHGQLLVVPDLSRVRHLFQGNA